MVIIRVKSFPLRLRPKALPRYVREGRTNERQSCQQLNLT